MKEVDIIIIGSGMAGLYSAYNIKNISPDTSFLILEKYNDKTDDIEKLSTNCKNRIKEAKKEKRSLGNKLNVIYHYVNTGNKVKNYKKKYPFLRILKE